MTTKHPEQWRAAPRVKKQARGLRNEQTPAEAALWKNLRGEQLAGAHFRRQHPIGPFIVDFFCAHSRLIVEVDGDTHAEQEGYDRARTAWLESRGYRVIRFTNSEVHGQIDAVLEEIAAACQGGPQPASLAAAGEGPPSIPPAAAGGSEEAVGEKTERQA